MLSARQIELSVVSSPKMLKRMLGIRIIPPASLYLLADANKSLVIFSFKYINTAGICANLDGYLINIFIPKWTVVVR